MIVLLKKTVFFLAWIGILCLSLLGLNYVFLPQSLAFGYNALGGIGPFFQKMIILAISILYIILTIYKFLSNFEKSENYIQSTEHGVINIASQTLDNYILELLRRDISLENIRVKSVCNGKKIKVDIKTDVVTVVNVLNKVREIQELVKREVKNGIGVDINDVQVNLEKLALNPFNTTADTDINVGTTTDYTCVDSDNNEVH